MKLFETAKRILKRMSDKKHRIALSCAAILCSLSFIGGVSASFHSGTTGTQNITIAAYAVSAGSTSEASLLIDCNSEKRTASYSFWVGNEEQGKVSEVDVSYVIYVEIPTGLPEGILLSIDGIQPTADATRTVFTFSDPDFFLLHNVLTTNTHTLTFSIDEDAKVQSAEIADIAIRIIAKQID